MGDTHERQEQGDSRPDTSPLAKGLADVIQAGLEVGTALARLTAEATSGNKPVPEPRQSDNALNAIVHYGIASIVNVVDAVVHGVQEARMTAATGADSTRAAPEAGTVHEAAPTAPRLPTVHCGASLRIPLSIQNPGPEPMEGLDFVCLQVRGGETGPGAPLTPAQLRFEPATLLIAPRDFEKLTIYIDVPEDAAPGRYEATIGTTSGALETTINFDVVPAEEAP